MNYELVEVQVCRMTKNIICGAGVVDDKDLVVSSDQDNTWLFAHPTLLHERAVLYAQ